MEDPRPVEGGAEPPVEVPSAAPEPERYPFWGYSDVLLFVGLAIPSMLLGLFLVNAAMSLAGVHLSLRAADLIVKQFVGYAILFGLLALLFRVQHGRPFWRSLGWVPSRLPFGWQISAGMATALAVAFAAALMRTPNTPNQMTELMQDRTALILMTIFGTTLGPLCEELAFRGLLQPLLVRTFGAVVGVIVAALPFGLLHFQEYGYSWRHAVLISGAGAAFGWMRQATGSTKASTWMHSAYNALFFAVAFGKDLPQQ